MENEERKDLRNVLILVGDYAINIIFTEISNHSERYL
jgi:hypothetical protein